MRIHALAPLLACLAGCGSSTPAPPDPIDEPDPDLTAAARAGWRQQVIYLLLTDRFRDGDPNNNNATGCYDPANPRAFHGGDLEGVRQHLDYVRDVGATAIWITPPNRQAGNTGSCGYHGYWIDYTDPADDALQPELGTPEALDRLASDLHGAGMRLVLDMVVNHSGQTARLLQQHADWFHAPATCSTLGPPQVFCQIFDLPDLAQERTAVAAYLSALQARAAARYAVDAIRMDTVKHVLSTYFRDSFFPAVRAARPGAFVVGEVFEQGSLAAAVPYLDAGFDSVFHFPLYAALVEAVARDGSVDRIAEAIADGIARVGAARALDLVLFVDNHDVPRFASLFGGSVPQDEIRRRLLLALDLIFTLPGIPQLYYGDELGMLGAADPDNRRDLPAWAGDPAERAQPHPGSAIAGSAEIYARVQQLSSLRRSTPALADGGYRELLRQRFATSPNVLAFARGHGADQRIVVIASARSSSAVRFPVHDLAEGTVLVDELGDGAPERVEIVGSRLSVELPARSAAIYRVAP